MKYWIPILLIVLLASLVYNITQIEYTMAYDSELNLPYITGIGAGICGLILTLIFWRFSKLQKKVQQRNSK